MPKTLSLNTSSLSNATMRQVLIKLQTNLADFVLDSANLQIKAAESPLVKKVNTILAVIDGSLVRHAGEADMPALTGANVADASKNVYVFTVKAAGTFAVHPGTAATTLAGIAWPTIPAGEAVVGFVLVENGTGSAFVPGTTALDTGSLTVTYKNTAVPFNPNVVSL